MSDTVTEPTPPETEAIQGLPKKKGLPTWVVAVTIVVVLAIAAGIELSMLQEKPVELRRIAGKPGMAGGHGPAPHPGPPQGGGHSAPAKPETGKPAPEPQKKGE